MRVTPATVTALVALSSAASTTLAAPVPTNNNENSQVATAGAEVTPDVTLEPRRAAPPKKKGADHTHDLSPRQKKAAKVAKEGYDKHMDYYLNGHTGKYGRTPSDSHRMNKYAYSRENAMNRAYSIFPDQRYKDKAKWYRERLHAVYGSDPDDGSTNCTVM